MTHTKALNVLGNANRYLLHDGGDDQDTYDARCILMYAQGLMMGETPVGNCARWTPETAKMQRGGTYGT